MSSKCLNISCTSSPTEQLERATWPVCHYYDVKLKPYHRVCAECLKKYEEYRGRLHKCMINMECVFGVSTDEKSDLIDFLSDDKPKLVDLTDEDNDVPSVPAVQTAQECQLASLTKAVLGDMEPLIKKQFTLFENHANEIIEKRKEGERRLQTELAKLDKELSGLHNNLYKFDSSIQFEHEPEVIVMPILPVPLLHKKLLKPKVLPPKGVLERREIKLGDKVYANKCSGYLPWVEGTIFENINDSCGDVCFNVMFSDDEIVLDFTLKELAYKDVSNVQFEIGTRVIAIFHDSNPNMTNKFYPGVVAEIPKELNSYRYLIFFDDGYAQYAYHKEIRLVCYQSPDVSNDVDFNSKEFIKSYLYTYPERQMVKFKNNHKVRADYEGKWHCAKVVRIDASLVQLKFIDTEHKHTEWIYRGSNRLEPIYEREMSRSKLSRTAVLTKIKKTLNKPYVELEYKVKKKFSVTTENDQTVDLKDCGVVETIGIPPDSPQPISYKDHKCNYHCLSRVKYNVEQTTAISTLSIPLKYGFQRSVMEYGNFSKVMYITPCGRKIFYENEMYNYLKSTCVKNCHCMTIEMFNFDHLVNPLNLYNVFMFLKFKDDISGGLESKPISAVNCFDKSLPPEIKYITERKFRPGVNLNLDPKFLSCCDCTNNCEDKMKCSCWQQTINGRKLNLSSIGYQYKRLYEREDMGIFECNINCKCLKTCLNRVVQHPLSATLQVFKTESKGWGLRTLADIPKGSFICNYIGEIYKENDAETTALNNGEIGEYLSNLDYIEIVGELKEGYENDVTNPPDLESDLGAESNELKFRKSSRSENIQHSNTELNGKHKLSKLNSQQTSTAEISDKICYRQYYNEDDIMYVVDAKNSGNVSRYFNHSCDPNVFVQNVFVDTHDLRFPWQAYFASCFIPSGSELVYDYGYEVGSVIGLTVYCHCKSKYCKKRLL